MHLPIKRKYWAGVVGVLAVAAVCAYFLRPGVARTSGEMEQDIYVWQRAWNPAVRTAISDHAPGFGHVVPLAAEVVFEGGRPRSVRVPVDYELLKNSGTPYGIALRIGPYSGPFDEHNSTTQFILDLVQSLVDDAKSADAEISELQIDFDAASSRLDGYRQWVVAIKKRVPDVPIVITALPSWLDSGDFTPLVRTAGGFVLQVHSIQKPTSIDAPMTLCDVPAARRAVEKAARSGVPFRVALPTYAYLVAFDANGAFVGLSAEGVSRSWPDDVRLRELRADPDELAGLVADWTADRPALMHGIIWYRLPTAADEMNWRFPTLVAVMAGRATSGKLESDVRYLDTGLVEVDLVNRGDGEALIKGGVTANWSDGRLVAADAIGGFERTDAGGANLVVKPAGLSQPRRLAPGQRLTVAWMRFNQDTEVIANVVP